MNAKGLYQVAFGARELRCQRVQYWRGRNRGRKTRPWQLAPGGDGGDVVEGRSPGLAGWPGWLALGSRAGRACGVRWPVGGRAECGGRWADGRSAGRLGFQFHRFVGLGFERRVQSSFFRFH